MTAAAMTALRYALLVAGTLAVAGTPGLAETGSRPQASTLSAGELNEFMQEYYRSPAPESIVEQILRIDLGQDDRPEAVHLIGVFFAHSLHRHSELAAALVDQLERARTKVGAAQRARIAAVAIANAELADGRALLARLKEIFHLDMERMDRLGLTEPFEFLEFAPRGPHGMDICWVSFFATGDTRYVLKVAAFLDLNYRPPADPSGKIAKIETLSVGIPADDRIRASILGATATWALNANARRHPAVREALLAYAAAHPGQAGDAAQKIADDAATQQ
jgi:hypothetical protein